jgi:hypothetical protein
VGLSAGATTVKISIEFPQKTKNRLTYDPAIPLLGIYPKECKSTCERDTCTPMFIVTLCVCVYIYIYTYREREMCAMEFYSAIRKNGIISFAGKWMELRSSC